jgi:hypothetical protein
MKRSATLGLTFAAGAAALLALTAAQQPSSLAGSKPGLWEVEGIPGVRTPLRECVGDLLALARVEHRGKNCSTTVLSNSASSTVVEYRCAGEGFGRSRIDVITPRALRISTQGISEQLPFNYVLQARRVGDCSSDKPTLARH